MTGIFEWSLSDLKDKNHGLGLGLYPSHSPAITVLSVMSVYYRVVTVQVWITSWYQNNVDFCLGNYLCLDLVFLWSLVLTSKILAFKTIVHYVFKPIP